MPVLANYPVAKQAVPNSCWACAARSVANFNGGKKPAVTYASDQALADAYAKASKTPGNGDINKMQSAADALYYLGFRSNTDSAPLPTPDEILKEIKADKPILSIVGSTNPGKKPDIKYKKGHWVVIVGISDDKATISVFDRAEGKVLAVPYNAATYSNGVYWENSSYF
jgi:hypothetical protein